MANPTPAAELEIDAALVRALLVDQAPEFADLPIQRFASGWDNTIFALGDDKLVRLPHRVAAVQLVRNEQQWLPVLAPNLPVAIPVPIVFGVANDDFPWPWTIVERVPGSDAITAPPEPTAAVELLATFFAALHVAAPEDAPFNPAGRGGPLIDRDDITQRRFVTLTPWLDERLDVAALRDRWTKALDAGTHAGPPLWVHGDIHPGNVIVRDGAIVSVIDFGDLTSGDPATDLGSAWMFFDETARLELKRRRGVDDATWDRARGWALSVALAIADSSADNPRYEAMSERILLRVASDAV